MSHTKGRCNRGAAIEAGAIREQVASKQSEQATCNCNTWTKDSGVENEDGYYNLFILCWLCQSFQYSWSHSTIQWVYCVVHSEQLTCQSFQYSHSTIQWVYCVVHSEQLTRVARGSWTSCRLSFLLRFLFAVFFLETWSWWTKGPVLQWNHTASNSIPHADITALRLNFSHKYSMCA